MNSIPSVDHLLNQLYFLLNWVPEFALPHLGGHLLQGEAEPRPAGAHARPQAVVGAVPDRRLVLLGGGEARAGGGEALAAADGVVGGLGLRELRLHAVLDAHDEEVARLQRRQLQRDVHRRGLLQRDQGQGL